MKAPGAVGNLQSSTGKEKKKRKKLKKTKMNIFLKNQRNEFSFEI